MVKTIYRPMARLWALKCPQLLPTSSWQKWKQISLEPLVWKRFIHDIFSTWNVSREEIANSLSKLINTTPQLDLRRKYLKQKRHCWILRYTKAKDLKKDSVLDLCTHLKPTETFQYTHFTLCHPPGIKRGFVKGEALRPLKTNSSKELFEEKTEKT